MTQEKALRYHAGDHAAASISIWILADQEFPSSWIFELVYSQTSHDGITFIGARYIPTFNAEG